MEETVSAFGMAGKSAFRVTAMLVAACAPLFAADIAAAPSKPKLWYPDLTRPWMSPDALAHHRPAARAPGSAVPGFLLVEAEDFTDYGGWRLDTQFTHKMGSAYLIASSVGRPVRPASTSVNVPSPGVWRVWARTKDWLPEYSPGVFSVVVGGRESSRLGISGREGWRWERCGDFMLAAGDMRLELKDISGYFGRCDAVLLTKDLSYVPPDDMAALSAERFRLRGEDPTPAERGTFDVIVVGAGPGGTPAAIAAARNGARVALIGDRPVLGGNGSDEIGVNMCGAAVDKPAARETGIAEEVTCLRARFPSPTISGPYKRLVDAETNLTFFACERMIAAEVSADGSVTAVICRNTHTGARSRFRSGLFVDATGDGWLGYFAGAKFRLGREAASEFDEHHAPDFADELTMSGLLQEPRVGVCYLAEDAGRPVEYRTPAFADILPDNFRRPVSRPYGVWFVEHPGWFDDCEDPERARDELLRISFAYWGWVKNDSHVRGKAVNLELKEIPIMDGRRESRRLVGDYILNENDCESGRIFEDAVAYGGWPLDTHDPNGVMVPVSNGHRYRCDTIPVYSIPFRSLYSTNVPNLMMAGRDISATHIALGSTRVQQTCTVIGQAVGTAAAMCTAHGLRPRELGKTRIAELQQRLLEDDCYIPGFRNLDARDLARTARVTASSSALETKRFSHGRIVTYANVSPSNVIDGVSRPVDGQSHAWISADGARLPQWIRLDLARPSEVSEIRLTFDTDLEFNAWHNRAGDELVRSYVVEGSADGEKWTVLADETDNFMRHRVHRFPPRTLSAVRLTVRATYGCEAANVFEIRIK